MRDTTNLSITGKEKIIDLLRKEPEGLLIKELAEKSGISRYTARVILAELFGARAVKVRNIGKAKMHYWRKSE